MGARLHPRGVQGSVVSGGLRGKGTSAPKHQPFTGHFTSPADAQHPDPRSKEPVRRVTPTAQCPRCGAVVNTRLGLDHPKDRTRFISRHRLGGGVVSTKRPGDIPCGGEGMVVA